MKFTGQRRFEWWRIYNGFWTHAKWRFVAKRTGISVTAVTCIAGTILEAANRGRPRGSIADFCITDCAGGLDLPLDDVCAVYRELEMLGWIDREHVVKWDERQPDREDPTTIERSRRYRDRKRAAREAAQQSFRLQPPSRVTDRDSVTRHSPDLSKKERVLLTSSSFLTAEEETRTADESGRSVASALPTGALPPSPSNEQAETKKPSEKKPGPSPELEAIMRKKLNGDGAHP